MKLDRISHHIEIYIHIPFCIRKCNYCDFLSSPANDETIEAYVNALVLEIKASAQTSQVVDSIFIGGGTPSILNKNQITKILDAIKLSFLVDENAEITIEVNPNTADREKFETYKKIGINRISIGLQSANDAELKAIGRLHTYAEFLETYKTARECGFENINVDIMEALPHQKKETLLDTVKKVIDLNPEHISAYSLIVEEGTLLKTQVKEARLNGLDILPSEDEEREMYELVSKLLADNNYIQYEISNYSKKGYECRHNVGYWKRKDYMGMGIGAASLFKKTRYNNISDLTEYIKIWNDNKNPLGAIRENITELSLKDEMEEFMFLGLRMTSGISKEEFLEKFNTSYETVYGGVDEKLCKIGMLESDEKNVWLTKKGRDLSNIVLAEYLLD